MYAQRTLEGISIHAPLRERQFNLGEGLTITDISIHAPSRERLRLTTGLFGVSTFQSTLPRGSDFVSHSNYSPLLDFNPRSLAGATYNPTMLGKALTISIHAPSRERPIFVPKEIPEGIISIHAPSRERPFDHANQLLSILFQSTLPRGSDTRNN